MDSDSGTVEVEVDGKIFRGSYTVTSGSFPMVWVRAVLSSESGYKSAELGSGSAEAVARVLLREIIERAKQVGRTV